MRLGRKKQGALSQVLDLFDKIRGKKVKSFHLKKRKKPIISKKTQKQLKRSLNKAVKEGKKSLKISRGKGNFIFKK